MISVWPSKSVTIEGAVKTTVPRNKDSSSSSLMKLDNLEMVSELHARKAALEAKLAEKNRELKRLCIEEAELTGILPPEIPLEPGESPPTFRRRIGTAFTIPENLINNAPKFKEEETLSTLELEWQIQSGISEAALGLANDEKASKAVRRKHRHLYQMSQRQLADIQGKLNALRQRNQLPKQRKKPRPPLETESSSHSEGLPPPHDGGISLSPMVHELGVNLSPQPAVQSASPHRSAWDVRHPQQYDMRHSATHDGLVYHQKVRHQQHPMHPHLHRQGSGGYFPGAPYPYNYSTLASCSQPEIERLESRRLEGGDRRERLDQGISTPGYWLRYEANEIESAWFTTPRQGQRAAYNVRPNSHQPEHLPPHPPRDSRSNDRFTNSLDRRKAAPLLHGGSNPSLESWSVEESEPVHTVKPERVPAPAYSHPLPVRQKVLPPVVETLLPGQTYPEHGLGLVRTQSLGSVEALKKHKEKEWYETSLDAAPVPPPVRRVGAEANSEAGSNLSRSSSNVSSERRLQQTRNRETPPREGFESVVPFESPKNHTVVQPGKWQPYREVTKPFEMSDFYKYSTKFRKNDTRSMSRQNSVVSSSPTPVIHSRALAVPVRPPPPVVEASTEGIDKTPQQKGVYQPLQPMACSPMDPNAPSPGQIQDSVGEAFSSEMIAWYQDKSLPRSATLV